MRGVRHTLSRIPMAANGVLSAALLAGSLVSAAQAQSPASGNGADEQTAFAFPRVLLHADSEVAMPQPLDPSDAARVRRIFALQGQGKLADADTLIADLQNKLLLGAILADRYLGPYHHSTAAELRDWLAHYGDQPDAPPSTPCCCAAWPRRHGRRPRRRRRTWLCRQARRRSRGRSRTRNPASPATPSLDRAVAVRLQQG